MSVESLSKALAHRDGLTPAQKLVLVGIANHDGDGGSWPSIATLAGYAQVSARQAQRAVAALVELGLVTVEPNAGGNAKTPADRRPNRYTLHLDGVSSTSPRAERGVAGDVPRGVAGVADGVSPVSPEPSTEPSEEPSTTAPAAPTPDSEARRVCDDYWKFVQAQSGRDPVLGYMALVGVVKPLLVAGWTAGQVKYALAEMFKAGRSLSRQSVEVELRRRRGRGGSVDDDRGGESGPVAV